MAVPKRKTSKSRKRLRRGGHAAARTTAQPQACPRCNSPKLAHRVCDTCGYYGGKKRIEVEEG